MKLPRVSTFEYDGTKRVAIERGPDKRGCGMFCLQVEPKIAERTFKPGKMIDSKQVGFLKSLYYLAKTVRVG